MSMATGTAIAVGAAITAGAGVTQAVIGSKASHDAAATQAASGQKALDLQKSIYDLQQQNLAPYRQAGNVGLASLTGRVQNPGTLSGGGNGWVSSAGQPSLASIGAPPAAGAPMASSPQGSMGLGSMTSGQTVLMRSPDGLTTKPVPAELVDHYRQQGAQVVSNGGGALPRLGAAA